MVELVDNRFVLVQGGVRIGGLSVVRQAVDSRSGSLVALKFIQGHSPDAPAEIFFERETSTLRALDHPNIVRMIDAGQTGDDGAYYVALEWVEGNLHDEWRNSGAMPWERFFDGIGLPLADALAHAHLNEIEHRDIKPQNVLMTPEGVPKLADFGIAKLLDKVTPADPSQTVAAFRSGVYAPPELDVLTPYVRDTYAFGVLAIQMMTAAPLADRPDIPPALDAVTMPPELRKILRSCIDPDPAGRPANGAVLEKRLRDALNVCRVRDDRERLAIWLRMTRSAARSLLGADGGEIDIERAQAAVLADISKSTHAEYDFDHKADAVDKSTIVLIGEEFRYLLVFEREASRLAIVTASRQTEDWLEAARIRACGIEPFARWDFRDPGNSASALGLDALQDALDEHRAQKERPATDVGPASDLFVQWQRLVDAREELARGQHKPLEYNGWRQRSGGREITFDLVTTCELTLDGEQWEVVDPQSHKVLARGEVVGQKEDSLTVRFAKKPKVPERGRLVLWLGPTKVALQRQVDALTAVTTGSAVNPALRQTIIAPERVEVRSKEHITTWFRSDLDESKREVVRHALGSQDLLIVEGPPGTGKTTVIAEIVAQQLARTPRARILIVSQTHIAIDNALRRLDEAGIKHVVRLGLPDDRRVAEDARHLLLDHQVQQWAQEIRKRATKHITRLAASEGLDDGHLRAALVLEVLASTLGTIEHLEARVRTLTENPTTETVLTSGSPADDAIATREKLDDLYEQRDAQIVEARRHLNGALTLREPLTRDDARAAVGALVGQSATHRRILALLRLQGEWLQRIGTDYGLKEAFLRSRTVVGGTAIGFLGLRSVRDFEFDLCIFDEASKATATEALVPLVRARRWILIGDENQLPPIDEDLLRDKEIMADFQLTDDLVKTTLFKHLTDRTAFPVRQRLREQYRMIQPIGDLISACFYDGDLVSPRTDELAGYRNVVGKPVLWLDTRRLGPDRREQSSSGHSVFNRVEARIAVKQAVTIDRAIDHGLIKKPDGRDLDLLLIAPYRRQVDEIQRKLAGEPLKHVRTTVLSVDAVQGREADLAIFSITRSNDSGRLGFLGQDYWRRINVALSRARFGLVIVGDAGFCGGRPGALQEVLTYLNAHRDDCEVRDADHG